MALSSACELLRNLESRPASCAIWVRSSPTHLRGLTGVLLLLKRAKLLAGDPEVVSSSFSAESSKNPPITSCEDRAGLSAGGKMGELEISSRKTGGMTMWVRRNQTKKKKKKRSHCDSVAPTMSVSGITCPLSGLQAFSKVLNVEMAPVRKIKDQGGESSIWRNMITCQLI